MRIVYISDDNALYVDNISKSGIDFSSCGIPTDVHALQWHGDKGWIEFYDNADGTKPENEIITELPAWVTPALEAFNSFVPPPPTYPFPLVN